MQLTDYPLSFAVAACVTAAALTANLFAQPRTPIDLGEVRAADEKRFAAADADGDGLVSEAEFAAMGTEDMVRIARGGGRGDARRPGAGLRPGQRDAMRARADARKEKRHADQAAREFEAADADGDGQISTREYEGIDQARRAARQTQLFARLDADGDGMLTRAEFPSVATRLETLDADGDGKVTPDEIRRGFGR